MAQPVHKPDEIRHEVLEEDIEVHRAQGDAEVDKYAQDTAHVQVDAATNKRLFRKINKRILAVMLGSLDKGTLGFSSIMGIQDDANLKKNDYSWLGTILYMGVLVGGLIAYGISHVKDAPIYSWQLLFMVLGLVTVVWSGFIAWYLPDSPMKAKCYDEEEKRLMFARVRGNQTGMQNKHFKKHQLVEAVTDPFVWCCVLLQVTSTLIIGGLGVFSNLIIKAFGFSVLQTQLLNIAQGAVTILVMVGGAMLAGRTGQTLVVMFVWALPAITGTAILMGIAPNSKNAGGLLVAFYCTQFILAEGNLIFSLISRNIAGQTKKSMVSDDRKDTQAQQLALQDLTDKENPEFRYVV
ncbi:hypothetical protein SLS56_005156 [Neofusicoccum ribis]|uniref:Uncharacterized protein n=1 Tax=Neofusicoccum ribis TaxID=45134 RepID=A0ABR3SUE1_9PEZI